MDEKMMQVREIVMPLMIMRDDIYERTMLRPTAIMLPLGLVPESATVFGLDVVPGDRAALMYGAGPR